jgi:UrcA family protein
MRSSSRALRVTCARIPRRGTGLSGELEGRDTMRMTILFPIILLTACVESHSEPGATWVAYGDLRLASPEGRAVLRQRVSWAARRYCAGYGAEITPRASRADPAYCIDMFRSWIMGKMRPQVRRAYMLARKEAGMKGRQN